MGDEEHSAEGKQGNTIGGRWIGTSQPPGELPLELPVGAAVDAAERRLDRQEGCSAQLAEHPVGARQLVKVGGAPQLQGCASAP